MILEHLAPHYGSDCRVPDVVLDKKAAPTDRDRKMSQGGLGTDGWLMPVPTYQNAVLAILFRNSLSGRLGAALRAQSPARVFLDEHMRIQIGDPLLALDRAGEVP